MIGSPQTEIATWGTRAHLAWALTTACLAAVGCIYRESEPSHLHYSPDGRFLAWTWEDQWIADFVVSPDAYTVLSQDHSVRWCPIKQPASHKRARVDTARPTTIGHHLLLVRKRFSPDGRHLAVVTRKGIGIVALDSGEQWRLSSENESVTSFAWLNAQELLYVTVSPAARTAKPEPDIKPGRRTFWRQNVCRPGLRTPLLNDQDSSAQVDPTPGLWPNESFSPCGRWCLFNRRIAGGPGLLLETETGRTHKLTNLRLAPFSVSWRRDGSAALAVAYELPPRNLVRFLLIEPATRQVTDLTKQWKQSFQAWTPFLDPVWTADGRYVVVNGGEPGGALVQPRPWKVIQLGYLLARNHPAMAGYTVPCIGACALPGWVTVWQGNRLVGLADYRGESFVHWEAVEKTAALSPDGKRLVEIDNKGVVRSRPVRLPQLSEGS